MAALLKWVKWCAVCDWQEQEDYRLSIIFLLQRLTRLDQEKVTAEEKVGPPTQRKSSPQVYQGGLLVRGLRAAWWSSG